MLEMIKGIFPHLQSYLWAILTIIFYLVWGKLFTTIIYFLLGKERVEDFFTALFHPIATKPSLLKVFLYLLGFGLLSILISLIVGGIYHVLT